MCIRHRMTISVFSMQDLIHIYKYYLLFYLLFYQLANLLDQEEREKILIRATSSAIITPQITSVAISKLPVALSVLHYLHYLNFTSSLTFTSQFALPVIHQQHYLYFTSCITYTAPVALPVITCNHKIVRLCLYCYNILLTKCRWIFLQKCDFLKLIKSESSLFFAHL